MQVLIDQALKKLDPSQSHRVASAQKSAKKINSPAVFQTRYIPAKIKREIWVRDQGLCQYKDPLTNRRCGSTYRLEYDHKKAFARGGLTNAQNMRLFCKAHNLHKAIKEFGPRFSSEHFRANLGL